MKLYSKTHVTKFSFRKLIWLEPVTAQIIQSRIEKILLI